MFLVFRLGELCQVHNIQHKKEQKKNTETETETEAKVNDILGNQRAHGEPCHVWRRGRGDAVAS